MGRFYRVINVRFKVDGLHFDAAIDPDWQMHHYPFDGDREDYLPIEVYCFNHPEWDVLVFYQTKEDAVCSGVVNEQQDDERERIFDVRLSSACDFDKIIEKTREWIENNKEED